MKPKGTHFNVDGRRQGRRQGENNGLPRRCASRGCSVPYRSGVRVALQAPCVGRRFPRRWQCFVRFWRRRTCRYTVCQIRCEACVCAAVESRSTRPVCGSGSATALAVVSAHFHRVEKGFGLVHMPVEVLTSLCLCVCVYVCVLTGVWAMVSCVQCVRCERFCFLTVLLTGCCGQDVLHGTTVRRLFVDVRTLYA